MSSDLFSFYLSPRFDQAPQRSEFPKDELKNMALSSNVHAACPGRALSERPTDQLSWSKRATFQYISKLQEFQIIRMNCRLDIRSDNRYLK
jgi:hypothetical protein